MPNFTALTGRRLRYATQLSLSGFSSASYIAESWYGLRYYKTIETLSKDLTKNTPKLIDKLLSLKEQLFTFHHPELILSCSKEMLEELQAQDFFGLCDIKPSSSFTPWNIDHPVQPITSQARIISSQVAFTSEAFKTISYLHPYAPALTVATVLFDNKFCIARSANREVPMAVAHVYNSGLGHFNFHSYRDPHILPR